MTSDLDLLRQFARENSQDAFTEIVRRHVNIVYSAALRQVRSPQLAEEIAQSVFADLARNAKKLKPDMIVTAWLYSVTRRTAIDAIRKESRRQLREQIAVEMQNMNATVNEWTQIEPLLDDAMTALDETDRAVILLRYFENKNLREVGESLKISDDAAQKRVSRAVERLREFFSKQKITIGASGLVILISANAVQSAPVGLSAAILTATSGITATLGMTMIHKILIAGMTAAAIGSGIYSFHLQKQIGALQQQQAALNQQIAQLSSERDDAKNQLAIVQQENEQLRDNENEILKLRGEVSRLRQQNMASVSSAKAIASNSPSTSQEVYTNSFSVLVTAAFVTASEDSLNAMLASADAASPEADLAKMNPRSQAFRDFIAQYPDAKILDLPAIQTGNGMQAIYGKSTKAIVSGTNTDVGEFLDVTPNFTPDVKEIGLKIRADHRELTDDIPPALRVTTIEATANLSIGNMIILHEKMEGDPHQNFLLVFITARIVQERLEQIIDKASGQTIYKRPQ